MKPSFIISCPIDTYSGYGARARDIVKALIQSDKYDIKILPQRWGNTPWGFIQDHPEWEFLTPYLLPVSNTLPFKPKIWMQITVPNEFSPVGDYNIGVTAGIETTVCVPSWIEGLNRMDLNLVSSNHSKEVFINSKFQKQDSNGRNIEDVFLKKPIEVLLEGADLTQYFPSKETNKFDLKQIKESFVYLFVGHWMQGNVGEDRKNVGLLIQTFFETFKNTSNPPALLLKTSGAGASYLDRDVILSKIHQIKSSIKAKSLPNIYLLHGELSNEEINNLYNHKKVKAMISLTKGEGFGRPLLEFSLTKKPIIATNWSGHTDFLNSKYTTLIKGELKPIDPSAVVKDMIIKESSWFSPDVTETSYHLSNMFKNYKEYEKKAMLQYHKSKNNFSFECMVNILEDYLNIYLPDFPSSIELKLPQLNQLSLPKLNKLKNV